MEISLKLTLSTECRKYQNNFSERLVLQRNEWFNVSRPRHFLYKLNHQDNEIKLRNLYLLINAVFILENIGEFLARAHCAGWVGVEMGSMEWGKLFSKRGLRWGRGIAYGIES